MHKSHQWNTTVELLDETFDCVLGHEANIYCASKLAGIYNIFQSGSQEKGVLSIFIFSVELPVCPFSIRVENITLKILAYLRTRYLFIKYVLNHMV